MAKHGIHNLLGRKAAFKEVLHNPPKVVKKTLRNKGKKAARRQMIAIALAKSRRGY